MPGDLPTPGPIAVGACQHLWLRGHHDVYQAFACADRTDNPSSAPPWCWQIRLDLTVLARATWLWLHCPAVFGPFVASRPAAVGYDRWDGRCRRGTLASRR